MKKIDSKQKCRSLMKLLIAQDLPSNQAVVKRVLINKTLNYLYLKLPEDGKSNMLAMLRNGITDETLSLLNSNLDETDQQKIAEAVFEEVQAIYNSALIKVTNGTGRNSSYRKNC